MNLLLYLSISFLHGYVYISLHERGFLYMHTPHQDANSTPPLEKSGYGPELYSRWHMVLHT